jgi:hypothetical protein
LTKRKRNYRKEYDDYHASPEQKKRRAERNRDRKTAEKKYGKKALEGKEVDHVGSHRKGSLKGIKTRIISKKANRKRQPKRS